MQTITNAISEIKAELPDYVTLVAVSKYHIPEKLMEAYNGGQRVFGENRPQEMTQKHEILPEDICWHMIGHLQTNKVKMIVPYVSMIESVDSEKLLKEIDRQAERVGRKIPVLIEIHVAAEETKSGFTLEECRDFIDSGRYEQYKNVIYSGLMCMASHTDDEKRIHSDFRKVFNLYESLKSEYFSNDNSFAYRSWGMSEDYKIAVQEGSNIVRIGRRIFGERDYTKSFTL